MELQIIEKPFKMEIYGVSGKAQNRDYAGTAFKLSGKMWEVVKRNGIKNKGQNIWVYDAEGSVFAGVELDAFQEASSLLDRKTISMDRYAYFKHIGSYRLIKQVGQRMTEEIMRRGFETSLPYVEIYGHWNSDESKLETELLMSVH